MSIYLYAPNHITHKQSLIINTVAALRKYSQRKTFSARAMASRLMTCTTDLLAVVKEYPAGDGDGGGS